MTHWTDGMSPCVHCKALTRDKVDGVPMCNDCEDERICQFGHLHATPEGATGCQRKHDVYVTPPRATGEGARDEGEVGVQRVVDVLTVAPVAVSLDPHRLQSDSILQFFVECSEHGTARKLCADECRAIAGRLRNRVVLVQRWQEKADQLYGKAEAAKTPDDALPILTEALTWHTAATELAADGGELLARLRGEATVRDSYDDCTQLRAALSDAISHGEKYSLVSLNSLNRWRAALRGEE